MADRFSTPRFRGLKPTEVTWSLVHQSASDFEIREVVWAAPGWRLDVIALGGVAIPLTWHPYLRIGGVRVQADHFGIGFDSLTAARDHAASAFQSVRRALAKEQVS